MAAIGIAIESGSMHTVVFEPASGDVLADRTLPLDPDAATALTTAIETMRVEASTLDIDVDALGVVYRSDAERAEFVTALGDEQATLYSASESFLGWLTRSNEFAHATAVLLYYMGDAGVSISLADVADASLTPVRTATLDSMSPERIGSTIPLAWEVVDQSGTKPEFVGLFGDPSSNRDLVDILSLGLGVPVVRVADADRIAARGAALLALENMPPAAVEATETPAVVPTKASPDEPELLAAAAPEAVEPEAVAAEEAVDLDAADVPPPVTAVPVPPAVAAKPVRSGRSGRKLVLAAVLLAGVLSAGAAVAATLPGDSESTAENAVGQRNAGADMVGATRPMDPTTDPAAALSTPPPLVAPPPEAIPPTRDPATIVESAPTTQSWATEDAPAAVPTPQWVPAPTAAPAPVAPPQFTVPVVVPEPGKSQAQLEQEAWDRHWQQTDAWIHQELSGN
ncbi:hypothetical protein [Rhodococcus sp. AW25M09]|uniref:hypothetical protein n=1 Tax=Rhodococcus sp. AW25M09 TaxID=1268303 RepID=UPI00034BD11C|nr:hypothetical protein [Rhodococcus sp. AW25M09]